MSKPVERRLMTPDEMQAVERMACVTFPVASFDKRFYRNLSSGEMITEKQVPQLWRIFIRYRRQMNFPDKERLLKLAAEKAAPDFRKQNAAAKEQAEIDRLKKQYAEQMASQTNSQPNHPTDN